VKKKLDLLSVFQLICILLNETVWDNFGEGVRGTGNVEKHCGRRQCESRASWPILTSYYGICLERRRKP
jgi:hypothetical protein